MAAVLSRYQAAVLLAARDAGAASAATSPDLGRTEIEVPLGPDGPVVDGNNLPWPVIEQIAESETSCFAIEGGEARKIQGFSEETGRVYTLYPTPGAPTMLVSGVPMHRIKGIDPIEDTRRKIKTIAPIMGRVLDTATGLGYTAIEAARTATSVLTIELEEAASEIARQNPWSRELFDNPRIERRIGDSFEVVQELPSSAFDRIIHDPPLFSLAGELYSGEFYRQLYRLLAPGGRLFHYIGDPESRTGASITRSASKRLQSAGFKKITPHPEAFGVVAAK